MYKIPNIVLFIYDKKNTIFVHKIGKWRDNEVNTVLDSMGKTANEISFIIKEHHNSYILRLSCGEFREIALV